MPNELDDPYLNDKAEAVQEIKQRTILELAAIVYDAQQHCKSSKSKFTQFLNDKRVNITVQYGYQLVKVHELKLSRIEEESSRLYSMDVNALIALSAPSAAPIRDEIFKRMEDHKVTRDEIQAVKRHAAEKQALLEDEMRRSARLEEEKETMRVELELSKLKTPDINPPIILKDVQEFLKKTNNFYDYLRSGENLANIYKNVNNLTNDEDIIALKTFYGRLEELGVATTRLQENFKEAEVSKPKTNVISLLDVKLNDRS